MAPIFALAMRTVYHLSDTPEMPCGRTVLVDENRAALPGTGGSRDRPGDQYRTDQVSRARAQCRLCLPILRDDQHHPTGGSPQWPMGFGQVAGTVFHGQGQSI